jgi:predicted DNA-binding transcriptional regulator AlpA
MSSEGSDPECSGVATSRAKSPRSLDFTVSVNRETVKGLVEEMRRAVSETVREEMLAQRPKVRAVKESEGDVPVPKAASRGVELPPGEPLKAKDLRTALLLGKIPENAGLLVDADTTAQLMSISQRTLYRLICEKAIPEPLRISGRLLRWRLGELLEWIEAGCPHTKHWTYSPTQGRQGKHRK